MRGGLDEALARMARLEELRRRTEEANAPSSAVTELVAAVRRILERHPQLYVTVLVEGPGTATQLEFVRRDGDVQITTTEVTPQEAAAAAQARQGPPPSSSPPDWPIGPSSPPDGSAAQLAELLRQDPSMFTGPGD